MAFADILSGLGNVLDTPGSVVRGMVTGNPGRALGGIFDPSQRVHADEILGDLGGPIQNLLLTALTDPLAWGAGAGAWRLGSKMFGRAEAGAQAAKQASQAEAMLGQVGKSTAAEQAMVDAAQAAHGAGVAKQNAVSLVDALNSKRILFNNMRGFVSPEALATGAERTYKTMPIDAANLVERAGLGTSAPNVGTTITGGLHPNLSRPDKLGSAGVPPPFIRTARGAKPQYRPEFAPVDAALPTPEEMAFLQQAAKRHGAESLASIHSPADIFEEAARHFSMQPVMEQANIGTIGGDTIPQIPIGAPVMRTTDQITGMLPQLEAMHGMASANLADALAGKQAAAIPDWMQKMLAARLGFAGGWYGGDAMGLGR